MEDQSASRDESRSFQQGLAAIQSGDLATNAVTRFSDLSRTDAKALAREWLSIPAETRVALMRRFDEISEERIDVNFHRALRIALDDPEPAVRQLAVDALWEDESSDLLTRLTTMVASDPSPDVRAQAAAALERYVARATSGEIDNAQAAEVRRTLLDAVMDSEAPYALQRRALEALGPLGSDPQIAGLIGERYESDDHGLQCSALYAMGRSLQARWLPTLLAELENDDPELRFEAARAAGALGSPDAIPALLEAARSDDVEVRQAAIAAIGQIGTRGSLRALERLLDDANEAEAELIEATIEDVQTVLDPFESS